MDGCPRPDLAYLLSRASYQDDVVEASRLNLSVYFPPALASGLQLPCVSRLGFFEADSRLIKRSFIGP